ncbi:caspase family protein [Reichenbachiella sp. MALMAid0571]|uniref:caspase family protein n=1 Tax=Reichenbachiella sp. MALMAid0571 TaxID=3143939 RepID=UPI0032DEE93B
MKKYFNTYCCLLIIGLEFLIFEGGLCQEVTIIKKQKYGVATERKSDLANIIPQDGHTDQVNCILFTPDQKFLISAARDNLIKIWDVASGGIVRTIPSPDNSTVESLAISPDGQFLFGGVYGKRKGENIKEYQSNIYLWEMSSGRLLKTFVGHNKRVSDLSVLLGGKRFVSASEDKTIRTWDIQTARNILTISGHQYPIKAIALSEDKKSVYAGGGEMGPIYVAKYGEKYNPPPKRKELMQWDLKTGKLIRKLNGTEDIVNDMTFLNGFHQLAVASESGSIDIYDTGTGSLVNSYPIPRRLKSKSVPAKTVISNRSSNLLFAAGMRDSFQLLDGRNMSLIKDIRPESNLSEYGIDYVVSADFNDDHDLVATAYFFKNFVDFHDISSGQEIRKLTGQKLLIPSLIKISTSGKYAAIAYSHDGYGGSIKILNLQTGAIEKNLTVSHDNIGLLVDLKKTQRNDYSLYWHSLAFSPDEKTVLAGAAETYVAWDVKSGKDLYSKRYNDIFQYSYGVHTSLDYSPDGKYLIIGLRSAFDISTSTFNRKYVVKSMQKGIADPYVVKGSTYSTRDAKFSPNGKYFATAHVNNELNIWDTSILKWGEYDANVPDIKPFRSINITADKIDFSPFGARLVCITNNNEIQSYDVKTGKLLFKHTSENDDIHLRYYTDIKVNPDGKTIAVSQGSASATTFILIYDIVSGELLKTLRGHSKIIYNIEFTPDGKSLLSTSDDGTVRLWDVESGLEVCSIIATGGTSRVITTPENYYMSSKDAIKAIGFNYNSSFFPIEQFDLAYNRPDLVVKKMGYAPLELVDAYQKAYEKRVLKMGFSPEMISTEFHLPEVEIRTKDVPVTTRNKKFKIEIQASDSKYDLDRLNVYINDIPVFGVKGYSLRDKGKSSVVKDFDIELSEGQNKIQVSAHNVQGTESLKQMINIQYIGEPVKPNLYIVAIGVSDYMDNEYDLTYAAKDATDFVNLMKSNTESYNNIIPILITDKRAVKQNIMAVKETLLESNVDDEVILFVAGHGLVDDNLDYYFGTYNVTFDMPSFNGLPYHELEGLLDGIPARKKLMLIDACHSGEIDKEESTVSVATVNTTGVKSRGFKTVEKKNQIGVKNSFEMMKELFADLRRGTGAMVISSASGVEFAFESDEWKNGVFTYAMLEGLKSGNCDADKSGSVQVSELKDYVFDRVEELTNGKQHPTSRRENLEFDFVVW